MFNCARQVMVMYMCETINVLCTWKLEESITIINNHHDGVVVSDSVCGWFISSIKMHRFHKVKCERCQNKPLFSTLTYLLISSSI